MPVTFPTAITHVGDIGGVLRLIVTIKGDPEFDLSTATDYNLYIRKAGSPATILTKTKAGAPLSLLYKASPLHGGAYRWWLEYSLIATDIDFTDTAALPSTVDSAVYAVQADFTIASKVTRTSISLFRVNAVIA